MYAHVRLIRGTFVVFHVGEGGVVKQWKFVNGICNVSGYLGVALEENEGEGRGEGTT